MHTLRDLVSAGAELGYDDRSFGDWSDSDILIYSAEMIGSPVDFDRVSPTWKRAVVTAFWIAQGELDRRREGLGQPRSIAEVTREALRSNLLA